jgi:hypothetical protein
MVAEKIILISEKVEIVTLKLENTFIAFWVSSQNQMDKIRF